MLAYPTKTGVLWRVTDTDAGGHQAIPGEHVDVRISPQVRLQQQATVDQVVDLSGDLRLRDLARQLLDENVAVHKMIGMLIRFRKCATIDEPFEWVQLLDLIADVDLVKLRFLGRWVGNREARPQRLPDRENGQRHRQLLTLVSPVQASKQEVFAIPGVAVELIRKRPPRHTREFGGRLLRPNRQDTITAHAARRPEEHMDRRRRPKMSRADAAGLSTMWVSAAGLGPGALQAGVLRAR